MPDQTLAVFAGDRPQMTFAIVNGVPVALDANGDPILDQGPQLPTLASYASGYDPYAAAKQATSIGPAQVTDRYLPPPLSTMNLFDVLQRLGLGRSRPPTIAAQDPYGIGAWEQGGEAPGFLMGATEAVPEGALTPAQLKRLWDLKQASEVPYTRSAGGNLILSTRVPTAKRLSGYAEGAAPLMTGLAEAAQDPVYYHKLAGEARRSMLLRPHEQILSDPQVLDLVTKRMAENNVGLVAMQDPALVARETQWYQGGHTLAGAHGELAGFSGPQAYDVGSALLAAESPTKEWNQNIDISRRLATDYTKFRRADEPFSKDAFQQFADTTRASARAWVEDHHYTGTKAADHLAKAEAKIEEAGRYIGRKFSDLPTRQQSQFIRAMSERHDSPYYPVYGPEGTIIAPYALGETGEKLPLVWQSYENLDAGLSVLKDPSPENISRAMGFGHKKRSFFTNLSDPFFTGASTADTHNVGGAHFRPMGGDTPRVLAVMGGAGSASTGIRGAHPLYREANALAAEQLGLRPNQLQSAGWEGIKGLFTPAQRRDPALMGRVDAVWHDFQMGRLSMDNAQRLTIDLAGGLQAPAWVSDAELTDILKRHNLYLPREK